MAKTSTSVITEVRKILITENKIRNIMVEKIGLPSTIAEWITSTFNEKFQLYFANIFAEEALKKIAAANTFIAQHLKKQLKGDSSQPALITNLGKQKGYFNGLFREIQDWLVNRRTIAPEADEINLKTLTLVEAKRRAEAWQEEVRRLQTGRIDDESGRVIKVYPDGTYWIDLQRRNCAAEARAMGHCGNGNGNLFSLRKAKQPSLTGDVDRGSLVQLRGRSNTKPKAEYHPYIMDFILMPESRIETMHPSSYKPEQNFELKDLSLENVRRLYSEKPRLFVPEELYKVLLKYPEFVNSINQSVTPLWDDHKVSLSKRFPEMKPLFVR